MGLLFDSTHCFFKPLVSNWLSTCTRPYVAEPLKLEWYNRAAPVSAQIPAEVGGGGRRRRCKLDPDLKDTTPLSKHKKFTT